MKRKKREKPVRSARHDDSKQRDKRCSTSTDAKIMAVCHLQWSAKSCWACAPYKRCTGQSRHCLGGVVYAARNSSSRVALRVAARCGDADRSAAVDEPHQGCAALGIRRTEERVLSRIRAPPQRMRGVSYLVS
eukprot:674010-Pleurochrysis_carterae.AAC.1